MDRMQLRIFQGQIELQCLAIFEAATTMNNALAQGDSNSFWIAVQNLLNGAANIAKVCWGGGGKFAKERLAVRRSVHITSRSPLKNVAMRNNFEHLDERIDDWWRSSPQHIHVDRNIGPWGRTVVIVPKPDAKSMFRHYDPQTTNLIFWGECFNIQRLVSEVDRIYPIVVAELAKPPWKPPRRRAAANGKPQRGATPSGSAPSG
jgi:hypothetical protein